MEFGEYIVEFFELKPNGTARDKINFYLLGLAATNTGYEHDLDRIIKSANSSLKGTPQIRKIGLTHSPQIANARNDVETRIGDFNDADFQDGLLFIPQPYNWARSWLEHERRHIANLYGEARVTHLDAFLTSTLDRTGMGVVVLDINSGGFPAPERAYLEEQLVARRNYSMAFVNQKPADEKPRLHILLKK